MIPNFLQFDSELILGTFLLANGDLRASLGAVAGIMHAVSLVVFFGGLIISGVLFMIGRAEYLKYGLVGASVGAMAYVLVSALYTAGSPVDPNIPMTGF